MTELERAALEYADDRARVEPLTKAAIEFARSLDEIGPGEEPTPIEIARQVMTGEHSTREETLARFILENWKNIR